MNIRHATFLPGVPEDLVRAALARSDGNELASGKLLSPDSSAALAANGFGWFIERPADLPPVPSLPDIGWPACHVEVERQMRFPWTGGRHPWLDAAIETATHVVGVESKRFEPFRDSKSATFSKAYDRDVWGERMKSFTKMRDRLRSGEVSYAHLDAVQLVKHAFGLVTEGRRVRRVPILLYLYAEPTQRGSTAISPAAIARHRAEIADFATAVAGAEVQFASCSWQDWLAGWTGRARTHADALIAHFQP
jgi:hypothetical protein